MARWLFGWFARPATYRRWVYFILGGALFVPFLLFGAVLVPAVVPVAATALGALLIGGGAALLVLGAVGFLPAVRVLEGAAVRELLDDPVPDAEFGATDDWSVRVRSAVMFAAHVLAGGVLSTLSLALPVLVAMTIPVPFTGRISLGVPEPVLVPRGWAGAWIPVLAVLTTLALVPVVATSGAVFRRMAVSLLGPSVADRIARLERRTDRLLERTRLARELHDSVGHALSIVAVQAGAARRLLRRDADASETALEAIEAAARAALDDLDHVLGLLREDGEAVSRAPRAGLSDLPALLSATRLAGVSVDADVRGDPEAVAPVVSREAYRIVQECLTNAVRHAGRVPVTVRVEVIGPTVAITVRNRIADPGRARGGRGGRGLRGMRERVDVLGGTLEAGPDADDWVVDVRLPTGRAAS
ncbi:sensor histidine kinase [Saccharomonospora cyanea]|uniref:histidine kinase n=1 Tax=Saccharomonospora cyanea NA-134 TaxID=882082 RepID=H5XKN2_9PSEU|nr:histidine kinase [Saccharomonospora cyanea]EHR60886.1 signal transduction histidine kinase [Saccharomonospora cyanea NA-134]